jgi:hypothetical protein
VTQPRPVPTLARIRAAQIAADNRDGFECGLVGPGERAGLDAPSRVPAAALAFIRRASRPGGLRACSARDQLLSRLATAGARESRRGTRSCERRRDES